MHPRLYAILGVLQKPDLSFYLDFSILLYMEYGANSGIFNSLLFRGWWWQIITMSQIVLTLMSVFNSFAEIGDIMIGDEITDLTPQAIDKMFDTFTLGSKEMCGKPGLLVKFILVVID